MRGAKGVVVVCSVLATAALETSVCIAAELRQATPTESTILTSELAQQLREQGAREARVVELERRDASLAAELAESKAKLNEIEKYLWVLITILGFFIALVVVAVRRIIKVRVERLIDESRVTLEEHRVTEQRRLESELDRRNSEALKLVEDGTSTALKHFGHQNEKLMKVIEESLFRYAQITALRFAKQYDAALAFANWQGDPKAFEAFPDAIQRHIITCLANSPKARADHSFDKSWNWAQALVDARPTVENVETMLRTANTVRHYEDAIQLYDSIESQLDPESRNRCEPFLIVVLRKASEQKGALRRAERLLGLAEKHRDSRDIRTRTTLAAVFRDRGKFEDAEMIMNPVVKKTTGFSIQEDGWDKLYNTYIANCIDLGRPEDAVPQVKTILAQHSRPDHIFNCARVAWRLSDDQGREIFRLITRRFEDGLMPEKDDGTIKTLAIIREVSGLSKEAEEILQRSIGELSQHGSRWARDQVYFFRCALAELFLSRDDAQSGDRALEVLEPVSDQDPIGEASYHIARAWLLKRNFELAETHLRRAADIRRKWIVKARYDHAFKQYEGLDELISKYVSG